LGARIVPDSLGELQSPSEAPPRAISRAIPDPTPLVRSARSPGVSAQRGDEVRRFAIPGDAIVVRLAVFFCRKEALAPLETKRINHMGEDHDC
jgi:hypothetical protein